MTWLALAAFGALALVDAPPPDGPTYEQKKAAAGRDAPSQIDLALWCEAQGLEAQRIKHLGIAVLTDPSNALARGLLGLVEYGGKWRRPEAVADTLKADMARADLMAEYVGKRLRTPVKPVAQWNLALWCEEKGLRDEARAHLATVVRLDPNHAEAWKKLGYRKVGRRWLTGAQAEAERAEVAAMKAAERKWKPLLARLADDLKNPRKRAEAERALGEVNDPRAVPWVWASLALGDPAQQAMAVQVLGQIDAIPASRGLALLAVFGQSEEVRRRAVETLRRRDPREFAGMLVAMLADPIKYQVRPVGGPGSPGALFVEGKRFNVQRLYEPPAMPNLIPNGGFVLGYDQAGYLVAEQSTPSFTTQLHHGTTDFRMNPGQFANFHPSDAATARAMQNFQANEPAIMQSFYASHPYSRFLATSAQPWARAQFQQRVGFNVSETSTTTGPVDTEIQIPIGRIAAEYQKSALVAEGQLENDVATLDRLNTAVKSSNDRVEGVLQAVSGLDLGDDREGWRKWSKNLEGYAYYATTDEPKPTVVEDVPLAYVPQPMPTIARNFVTGPTSTTSTATITPVGPASRYHMDCFGAGTLVRTLEGPRPIEALRVGDLVLAQNPRTGKLGYRPVLVVHHTRTATPTRAIRLGSDAIATSEFHRFWVAGRGWVMASNLKVGDPIRTLGGVEQVTAIEPGKSQQVYNLDVADDADFFAGSSAALVHDISLPDMRQVPFDAPAAVAAK